jgi:hypothetical protein
MSVDTVSISEAPTRLGREFLSVHFQERARHYGYAAALTDNPRNIQQFLDLAFMFERLACDFAAWEAKKFALLQKDAAPPLQPWMIEPTNRAPTPMADIGWASSIPVIGS